MIKWIVVALFLFTYICLLALPKYRAYIALACAAVFVVIGALTPGVALAAIDFNVLLMIAGTMGIVALFIESKMPALLADLIIKKCKNAKWAIVTLALFAGIISAFVDNVATVLMAAPVALNITKKLKISPVPAIIAISVASNLQGAATLVGDTTSILLGGYADMNFLDFFFFKGKISLFWIVELGAIVSTFVLLYLFRKDKDPINIKDSTKVTDYFPTVLLVGMIILLILASFIPSDSKPAITNGLICTGLFAIGVGRSMIKNKSLKISLNYLKEIDFFTLLLLASLFVVIKGLEEVKVVEDIGNLFVSLGKNNLFVIYTLIVWASVLFSAVIDNIPYVMTMLPVASGIAAQMGIEPYVLYFGLLVGATLGGNLTPIGASANITGIGILRKEGHEVSTGEFMKIGVPFTLAAVVCGYVLVWLIWR